MHPTVGNVFVTKAKKPLNKKFEVVDNTEAQFQVTKVGKDVAVCKKGDFVLFTDYKEYRFNNENIFIVKESDIVAVRAK
jgi:co-chaperonin GroES (HSP10)